jgi:hypothetical protein
VRFRKALGDSYFYVFLDKGKNVLAFALIDVSLVYLRGVLFITFM